jgi:hypothetical protein
MSESEIKRLEERIARMSERKGRVISVIKELESVLAEVDVEIQADMLKLDAERYEKQ